MQETDEPAQEPISNSMVKAEDPAMEGTALKWVQYSVIITVMGKLSLQQHHCSEESIAGGAHK